MCGHPKPYINDYELCLFDDETIYTEKILIYNKKHELYTVNKHKIALNRDECERRMQADDTATLAKGYLAYSLFTATIEFTSETIL